MTATVVKPVSIKLDLETRARIDCLASARRRTAHWMMREAILQYVSREEKRESFRQDTLKAWEEFQQAGLHASSDDVEAWLSSWGTESELPVPVCQP